LEIFEDGAVIRYQFVGAPEDREASENLFKTADKSAIAREMERRAGWFRRYAQQDIVLSDDLGTEYRVQPRGASGGTLKWESGFTISPSIPPDACQLRLTVAKLDFPWDLPGQTDSDPATFLIDL
jgi:hypothetical protein